MMDGVKRFSDLGQVMTAAEFSPYLTKLLALYDEKRKRFRWTFTLLLLGTIAFFLLVFFPYLTLLGNRADCLAQQIQCTQLETSILEERFTELSTSWGNVPISTPEVVVLFPILVTGGVFAATTQLISLMRLRIAIEKQEAALAEDIDLTLVAPILLDPRRGLVDLSASAVTFLVPVMIAVYSVSLIQLRLDTLRTALPYIQAASVYHKLYLLSIVTLLFSLAWLGLAFWRFIGGSDRPRSTQSRASKTEP